MTPSNFDHLISIRSAPWTFNFFDNNWFWLLFWNWVSIFINFLFFFLIFTIFPFFRCSLFNNRCFFYFIISFSWSIKLLLIIWVSSFIHVINWENLIRMWISRPYTKISISASGCKIFISKFAKVDNLNNLNIMCCLYYIVLILFMEAKYHEVTITMSTNLEISLLSCYGHFVKRLMRFVSITATL